MTMLLLTLSAALVACAVGAAFAADHAIDHRARRAAKRVGLIARKKHGGFQLIEPLQRRGGRGAL
jgi:hypothetical protein